MLPSRQLYRIFILRTAAVNVARRSRQFKLFHTIRRVTQLSAASNLFRHQRQLSTGLGIVPKGFFFRFFWTSLTAVIGFIYYKINQASSWMGEKFGVVKDWGLLAVMGAMDSWSSLREIAENVSWSPFLRQNQSNSAENPLFGGNIGDKSDKEGEGPRTTSSTSNDNFGDFIKRMIEVRNILKAAEMEDSLTLPSIVVIGSQSSGKSSVLESIVGHEFLPKGNNMVTRRPLELTLVNTPNCQKDYAVFSQLDTGPIYDFSQVQHMLSDMNLAVPEGQWVSNKPIELAIHSRNVPDLSLVDLPGYIQVNSKNQPAILRDKIRELCQEYIQRDNIILAVCPADVDLANSEALKASKKVDPLGDRTIGIITKLDLVNPKYSIELLNNEDYPLKHGYVGVICKSLNESFEDAYFAQFRQIYEKYCKQLGIDNLRQKLSASLEQSMAQSLSGVVRSVEDELANLKYNLKVEYNDRIITPEGYISSLISSVKQGLETVSHQYSRSRVREILQRIFQERLLAVIEDIIWNGDFENPKVELAASLLARSGVGKMSVSSLVDAIVEQSENAIKQSPLSNHNAAKFYLFSQIEASTQRRSQNAIEQVENAIKPLKHDIEYTETEWKKSQGRLVSFLKEMEQELSHKIEDIKGEIGARKLIKIVQKIDKLGTELPSIDQLSEQNQKLFEKAKIAVLANQRLNRIRERLKYLEEKKECSSPGSEKSTFSLWSLLPSMFTGEQEATHSDSNSSYYFDSNKGERVYLWNECQKKCPEVYLYLLMDRLLEMTSLHVHHELVREFLDPFPDEISAIFGSGFAQNRKDVMNFIEENGQVARHIKLIERRKILERVKEKLMYLNHLKHTST